MRHLFGDSHVILPGTGFTTKPGVAALRRTPGKTIEISSNPNGVPQRPMLAHKICIREVEPRWGSWGSVGVFLGCAVVTATPGFAVKPRWG